MHNSSRHKNIPFFKRARERSFITNLTLKPRNDTFVLSKGKSIIVILGVIDWDSRFQRPQQLATRFSAHDNIVIYVSPSPIFRRTSLSKYSLRRLRPDLYDLRLNSFLPFSPSVHTTSISLGKSRLLSSILQKIILPGLNTHVYFIVHHPYWRPFLQLWKPTKLLYDCMDDHGAFDRKHPNTLKEDERSLAQEADLLTFTSSLLYSNLGIKGKSTLIRNACDSKFFDVPYTPTNHPIVIGYVGAVSHWFDLQLLRYLSVLRPEWLFHIYGSTAGCLIDDLSLQDNVSFFGEISYTQVPSVISQFRVGIIPFVLSDLTMATNPVKAYEYAAVGTPIVATKLEELEGLEHLQIYTANSYDQFLYNLDIAVNLSGAENLITRRKTWAKSNDWNLRAAQMLTLLKD